jgi:hypothetical protein
MSNEHFDHAARTAATALFLGVTLAVASGCAGVEPGAEPEPEQVSTAEEADSTVQSYLSLPSSGDYSFYYFGGAWGTVSSAGWGSVPSGYSIAKAVQEDSSGNPRSFKSFALCNNTGSTNTFDVKIYSDFNYGTLWKEYPTFKVIARSCNLVNANDGSAFTVGSSKILW